MSTIVDRSLAEVAGALRARRISATELLSEALARHEEHGERLHAYKHFDTEGAREAARAADEVLAGRTGHTGAGDAGAQDGAPPPFCGIPISVKDLYGVEGMPIFAGTARQLPDSWSADGWLVARLRAQGAVVVGKTHTVELAYAGVGINPHWGTPWNPWDTEVHRIPGGSSCGAGVSLYEGSALLALGTDTGGSIRIPASMTGVVGHRTTKGRWPTTGVVPLSSTLDTVGALTRSVEDSAYFFGAVDASLGDPLAFLERLRASTAPGLRLAVPQCTMWKDCQTDIADTMHGALAELASSGMILSGVEGGLLDDAEHVYMHGGIAGAECLASLEADLPGWLDILHPTVGRRLEGAPSLSSELYAESMATHERMVSAAATLFEHADVLALPTAIITPPPVAGLEDHDTYLEVNAATLRPTGPVSMLGLCAVSIPVGLDDAGMPVGLQLVAPGGADERLLGVALAIERVLGTPRERLGSPDSRPGSPGDGLASRH